MSECAISSDLFVYCFVLFACFVERVILFFIQIFFLFA